MARVFDFRADVAAARPLVVCLTSPVAAPFTAQCLSALGAVPVMPGHIDDLPGAVARCDALLINLGTSDAARADLFQVAVDSANHAAKPWVLDPVGAGGGAWRTQLARDLVGCGPAIVKGNPAEVRALAGQAAQLKGVDSLDEVASALEAAQHLLAGEQGPREIVITGPQDACLDRKTSVAWSQGGHPWAPRVVTMGCALGAVCAASAAVYASEQAGLLAAQAFKEAASFAGLSAKGLGSFMTGFLDGLDGLGALRI